MLLSDLTHKQTHPRSHCHIYIVTMFGTNWSTFIESKESDSAIFQIHGRITQTVLIRLNP